MGNYSIPLELWYKLKAAYVSMLLTGGFSFLTLIVTCRGLIPLLHATYGITEGTEFSDGFQTPNGVLQGMQNLQSKTQNPPYKLRPVHNLLQSRTMPAILSQSHLE
jgi:hypothetical protein